MKVNREDEFRYSKLANDIRTQILGGYFKPGEYLQSENDLCKSYNLSRTSVRKALDILASEKLIIKKQGSGSIVSPEIAFKESDHSCLKILTTSPSHFVDTCMEQLVEAFESHYPNIKVQLIHIHESYFQQFISPDSNLNIKPDLIFVSDKQSIELSESNHFVNLTSLINHDIIENINPDLLRLTRQNEYTYLPITYSPVLLAYNEGLFEKYNVDCPNINWRKLDYVRAAQKLSLDTNQDGIVDQYGLSLSTSIARWPTIPLQFGVNFNNFKNQEQLYRSLDFIHDLVYRYKIATISPQNVLNSKAFFYEKAAMVLTTNLEIAGWKKGHIPFRPKTTFLNLENSYKTLLIANGFMVPSISDKNHLAAKFIEIALSEKLQQKLFEDYQFLSVLKSKMKTSWKNSDLFYNSNIENSTTKNGVFLHELFTDLSILEKLESEMCLYWAGIESAEFFSDRMVHFFRE